MNLLPRYRKILASIDEKIGVATAVTREQRYIVAATLFDVANEHAKAICTLLENSHYSSGFALLRTLFETFIRASWFLHCATDKQVDVFIKKDRIESESEGKLSFRDLLTAVEATRYCDNTLTNIRERAWGGLNSYTHGGQLQVSRRYDGKTIEPHYKQEELDEAIRFSAEIVVLIFREIADMPLNAALKCHEQELLIDLEELFSRSNAVVPNC